MQSLISVSFPLQGWPPFEAGVDTFLERNFSPPLHVFEHDVQAPYVPHTQFTGQTSVLQTSVSVSFPSHDCPPFDAGVATFLVRDFSPPPHVCEQDDHSP